MKSKPIFNSFVAKQLVLLGNKIIDLQPDKKKEGSIIFYFEINDKFEKDLKSLSHN